MTRLMMRLPPLFAVLLVVLVVPAKAELRISLADSLLLPSPTVTGLTWVGSDTLALLVVYRDSMVQHTGEQVLLQAMGLDGAVYWQAEFTGVLARGLAWDGEFFWSCGDDRDGGSLLYKIRADTVEVVASYPAPGHQPMALAFDGRWLWLSDRDIGRIDRIDPQTGAWTRSTPAPGFSPGGLAWGGRALWVTDAGTGYLTRLRGQRLEHRDMVSAEDWFLRGQDTLLAHDGRSLWILPPNAAYLRRVLLH